MNIEKLRKVEQLVQACILATSNNNNSKGHPAEGGAAEGAEEDASMGGSSSAGPKLPPRTAKKKGADIPSPPATGSSDPLIGQLRALGTLVKDDDAACVYLRECLGLKALAEVLVAAASAQPPLLLRASAALDALNLACNNDGNLAALPSLPAPCPAAFAERRAEIKTAIHAACSLLGILGKQASERNSEDDAAATTAMGSATRLLCTAATKEDVRKVISKVLAQEGGRGLGDLIQLLGGKADDDDGLKYAGVALLGNCMVDIVTKEAMRDLLLASPTSTASSLNKGETRGDEIGASLTALISPSTSSAVRERALALCGNMCVDPALRKVLSGWPDLVAAAVHATMSSASSTSSPSSSQQQQQQLEVQLAASTLLYNLSIEPKAQATLLALLPSPSLPSSSSIQTLMEGHEKPGSPASKGGTCYYWPCLMSHSDLRLASRVAGAVARCCKHPHASKVVTSSSSKDISPLPPPPPPPLPLLKNPVLLKLLIDLLKTCCKIFEEAGSSSGGEGPAEATTTAEGDGKGDKKGDGADGVGAAAGTAIEAVARALALLTVPPPLAVQDASPTDSSPDSNGTMHELIQLGGAQLLIRAIRHLLGPAPPGSTAPSSLAGASSSPTSSIKVPKGTRDLAAGNAALCIGHLASAPSPAVSEAALAALSQADAVQALIRVVYECAPSSAAGTGLGGGAGGEAGGGAGGGETAVRNSAIALAKLAKHPVMLERLRELHGIEIIMRNVKKF